MKYINYSYEKVTWFNIAFASPVVRSNGIVCVQYSYSHIMYMTLRSVTNLSVGFKYLSSFQNITRRLSELCEILENAFNHLYRLKMARKLWCNCFFLIFSPKKPFWRLIDEPTKTHSHVHHCEHRMRTTLTLSHNALGTEIALTILVNEKL